MVVIDFLVHGKLAARVGDLEFIEQRLNNGRSRHLTECHTPHIKLYTNSIQIKFTWN